MKTALRSIALVAFLAASVAALSAPSASISGEPEYTISNEGVRMLYVNPYDCQQPATPLSTWVIELDQPETVHSVQVSVVAGTIDEQEGAVENIVVRVGDNNPLEAGLSSNSLCTLAGLNASSSMLSFDCQAPVSGLFISISRNDAGNNNVCAFTANLGTVTFAPNNAPGPFVSVPAADLMMPAETEEPVAEVPSTQQLPVLGSGSTVKTYLALDGELFPAPAPGPVLAPMSADEPSILPVFSAASDDDSEETEEMTPAPAPAPEMTPEMAPVSLPVFAAVDAPATSETEMEVPVPAPAPAPVTAPEVEALPVFATDDTDMTTPAPAPEPAMAPVPAPVSDISSVFAAVETPVPAPAPAPGPMAPTPSLEAEPLISPSSPLISSLGVTPSPALPRQNFATQSPPSDSAAASDAAGQSNNSGSSGLSGGAIAGIVIGCVVGVALIAAVALYVTRHTNMGGRRFSSNV